MTDEQRELLKASVDQVVEIETAEGRHLAQVCLCSMRERRQMCFI